MIRRVVAGTLAVLLAIAFYATSIGTRAWTPALLPEPPSAQDDLERLDAALLPIHGALMAAMDDLGLAPSSLGLEESFLAIIQARAVQAWEVVRVAPYHECSAQYVATLRVGYALFADSIDSYRAQDRDPATGQKVFTTELGTALYLVRDRATLERNATTCAVERPTTTPPPTVLATATPSPS